MDAQIKLAILRECIPTLKPFLYDESVAYLTSKGTGDISLSSGTLITIGNRLFVATASDTIPMNVSGEIWILSGTPRSSAEPYLPILKKNREVTETPDVGYLELDAQNALSYLRKKACPIERIVAQGPGRPNRPVLLIGNPGQYVDPARVYTDKAIGKTAPAIVPVMISFLTTPLMTAEWPPRAPTPDQGMDIFLDYPDSEAEEIEARKPIMLPNPKGMSGGGLWDLGFEDGVLWSNQRARLFGIQTRWSENLRYVRAVQVHHWLKLIYQDYPDLQPILKAQFPGLH